MKATLKLISALSLLTLGTTHALAQGSGNGLKTTPLLRINSGGEVRFGTGASEQIDYRRENQQPIDFRARPEQLSNGAPCPNTYGPSLAGAPCNRPPAARTNIPCNVTFTGLDVEQYTSGGSSMSRLIISGRHNAPEGGYASKNFSVTDNDGFLTLAALHAHWQTPRSGVIRANSGFPASAVGVPAAELRLAREAAEMGLAYYRRGIERISVEPRPANYDALVISIQAKVEVLEVIRREVTNWETLPNGVPARRISAVISEPLERFATGIGNDLLMSQYRDSEFGDRPQLFCNSEADSAFVGRVLCSTNFVDGQNRDATFCGGGITFGEGGIAGVRAGVRAPESATPGGASQQ